MRKPTPHRRALHPRKPTPASPTPLASPDRSGRKPWAQDLLELGAGTSTVRTDCVEPAAIPPEPEVKAAL